jgi:hypothetical protein
MYLPSEGSRLLTTAHTFRTSITLVNKVLLMKVSSCNHSLSSEHGAMHCGKEDVGNDNGCGRAEASCGHVSLL